MIVYGDTPSPFARKVLVARALFLDEYADTRMAEVLGGVFFERWVKPNVIGQQPDDERVRESHSPAARCRRGPVRPGTGTALPSGRRSRPYAAPRQTCATRRAGSAGRIALATGTFAAADPRDSAHLLKAEVPVVFDDPEPRIPAHRSTTLGAFGMPA